ncbi:hypothetical protein [Lysinibacillus xylanilyticus]|uniref:Phage protein n=1 Tax=Lysinibacillus xylanilyticus TaxID=582475 RepID=A0ABT4EZF7_9BACI|nr:hypothetical protein [Lysinibacillus xylanilyticus]MCY9549604.1 hypothetical protein [Lysinibacillus xylanilyticus]
MAATTLEIIAVRAILYVHDYKKHAVLNKQEREALNTFYQYVDDYEGNNSYTEEIANI